MAPPSRGAISVRVVQVRPSKQQRAQETPDASRTRSLVCKVESTRVSHHRFGRDHPAFPAQWFYGLFRTLPGDRAFLPPSSLRSLLLKNLTPASGRQGHTTSPSANRLRKSHAAVLVPVPPKPWRRRNQRRSSSDTAASIASRINVRDDAYAPCVRKTCQNERTGGSAKPPVAGTEPVTPQRRQSLVIRARDSSGIFLNPNS